MSLFRQIISVILLIEFIVFSAMIFDQFQTQQRQIRERLLSDAKDSATTLGLSIATIAQMQEAQGHIAAMVDAVFDSGYYRRIVVEGMSGEVMYQKENPEKVYHVPQWFVDAVALEETMAQSLIMAGWQQYATLYVYNHNGHAYVQLWSSLQSLMRGFLLFFLGSAAALYLLLRLMLRPLGGLKRQAEAIMRAEFLLSEALPYTTELREVSLTMNAMVTRVKETFRRESEALARERMLRCFDAEFQIANKSHFMNRLGAHLSRQDDASYGLIILVEWVDVTELKDHYGYHRYAEFMATLISALQTMMQGYGDEAFVARFDTATLALMLPGRERVVQEEQIAQEIEQLCVQNVETHFRRQCVHCRFAIGLSRYSAHMERSTVMSHADFALLEAKAEECSGYRIYVPHDVFETLLSCGRERWVQVIEEAIGSQELELTLQRCMDPSKTPFHDELSANVFTPEGERLDEAFFVPIAHYAHRMGAIDRYLLECAAKHPSETGMAINLFAQSLEDAEMLRLLEAYAHPRRKKPRVDIEINSRTLLAHPEVSNRFVASIRKMGYRFGIDHFYFTPEGLLLIETLLPQNGLSLRD
ncbi:MAG: EAL domain-containing protein [Campylobacterales bacterium]|nr:EAL domain-containing protein [Campylobacterales bacterium]